MKTTVTGFVFGAAAALLLGEAGLANAGPHCQSIGGTVMTNFGVIPIGQGNFATLGVVDGDLKGSVSATILSVGPGANGTTVFNVQHHFVTQSGDTIFTDPATATAIQVGQAQGLQGFYAVINYPVHITGGTGRFAGATGDFSNIGVGDLGSGQTIFRYSGQLCFAELD